MCYVVNIFVSDEPYMKLDDKECWTKKYKQFSTVQLAKDACSADSNCKGVYDHECDAGAKDIYLCPISVLGTAYYSPVNSCVYQKNEPGKYSISLYLKTPVP